MIMATLLLGVFLVYASTQQEYAVGEEAQSLSNHLSKTAFSALTKQQSTHKLPSAVGKSNYELDIENNTFVVRIIGGAQEGEEYRSAVGIDLDVRGPMPEAGDTLYAQGRADRVIISSSPIEPPKEEVISPENFKPPDFYEFAKESPRVASGIIASYYYARQKYPNEENLDIESYEWESKKKENFRAKVASPGNFRRTIRMVGRENSEEVGLISSAWIVEELESLTDGAPLDNACPSVREAHSSGWLYSPDDAKKNLTGRTWQTVGENEIVKPPEDPSPKPASVTTNVSTYPAWRFDFESGGKRYVLYLGAMVWAPDENRPGFVFESKPDLEARV